jgi:hypothetical protein
LALGTKTQTQTCKSSKASIIPPPQQLPLTTTFLDYVRLKVVQEPATTAVDFETTKKACRHLFANFVTRQKAGNLSTHVIPDLLEVIRHAEMYRLRIIDQADLALEIWQVYYKKEDPQKALSEEEATAIGKIARPEKNWREVYLKVVDKLVGLVRHHYFFSLRISKTCTLKRICIAYLSRKTGLCRSS